MAVMVVGLMQNNNNTNFANLLNQTPNDAARQAKIPDERTSEAGYQKLPLKFRPKAGRAQRDPIDYDSHPYPIMKEFAEFLALRSMPYPRVPLPLLQPPLLPGVW